jgi:energy-coupling factor transporter ATP-binding protein EcfA2
MRESASRQYPFRTMDFTLTLPGGEILDGQDPVVVIGPNGSGKTRQTRLLSAAAPVEFINALRNTRVSPDLPAMGVDAARSNFTGQKNNSKNQHWELSNEFDSMLSQLLAQQSMAAMDFAQRYKKDPGNPGILEDTPLTRVEDLWSRVFPGRALIWRDWKPVIVSHTSGNEVSYSGNQMSDGEKAALYLAGRVFSTDPGILVVDEPETHFHSLLAVRLWNALEESRPDVRFVYVTHDLTFALSRRDTRFVLASPTAGLRTIELEGELPHDVTEALLGSASLSFYASRVVFCEGEMTSLDTQIYSAWFDGPDTVIRAIGPCERVLRCVDAVANSGIATGLSCVGIIDRDYYPEEFLTSLPFGIFVLGVHEVECLFCLPDLVAAVCGHVSRPFALADYQAALRATINAAQRDQIVIERWKRRMRPNLEALVSGVDKGGVTLSALPAQLPDIFDHTKWVFSPMDFLNDEETRVDTALSGSVDDFLNIVPGKQLIGVAARQTGLSPEAFTNLVCEALAGDSDEIKTLGSKVEAALLSSLPARYAAVKSPPSLVS